MSTRDQLLDSAERHARTRGYDGFSYADLAEEVGIRKASIHHHFPTKSDLAVALAERYRHRFLDELDRIARSAETGSARLRAYLDRYREALAGGEMVCLCVAFSAGRDSLSDAALREVRLFEEGSLRWLEETLRLGSGDGTILGVVDPAVEATACLALVEGAQLLARGSADVSRFDAAVGGLEARIEKH